MISAIARFFGIDASAALFRGLAVLILLAAVAFAFWRGTVAIENMVAEARAAAIAERDAHWTAQIEKSNAEVELRRLQDAHIAQQRSAIADEQINGLQAALSEMEKKNAALPNATGCGLSRARVRLLNR